jgi:hypothetical protein
METVLHRLGGLEFGVHVPVQLICDRNFVFLEFGQLFPVMIESLPDNFID